jgi:DNA polymerase-3 subunit alpha
VDGKAINKRMIESFIKSGSMDDLGERAQMLAGLDSAIAWGQNEQESIARGQTSLFDAGEQTTERSPVLEHAHPTLPEAEPLSTQERLEQERELLGFYVSGHPLDPYRHDVDLFCSHSSEMLPELSGDTGVLVVGLISGIRRITTRAQKQMAVLTCEDFAGNYEVVVFPDAYEAGQDYLREDQIVLIRGTRSRDEAKVVAAEIIPVDQARMRLAKALDVTVSSPILTEESVAELKRIVSINGGTLPVFIHVLTQSHGTLTFRVRTGTVNPTDSFLEQLERHPAVEEVKMRPAPYEPPAQQRRRGPGDHANHSGRNGHARA